MPAPIPGTTSSGALQQLQIQPLSLGGSALSTTLRDQLNGILKPRPSVGVSKPSTIFKPIEGNKEIRIFNVAADFKMAVSAVSMHLPAEWRRLLFEKIDALHEPDDWEETDRLADIGAIWTFLRTVLQQGPMKGMSLGIDNDGHILAAWKKGRDTLTLTFLAGDQIRWSVVQHADDSVESAAGHTELERLPAVLQPYYPEDWFGNGNDISTAR